MAKATQSKKQLLTSSEQTHLLQLLHDRYEKNKERHKSIEWMDVLVKLQNSPEKLWSLNEMEKTGGEPDLVDIDQRKGTYTFVDCSPESPSGRRSVCYDREGLASRKENAPQSSAMEMAEAMGIDLLSEQEYRDLQKVGVFDTKTSSWLKTPDAIRKLGGALFGDYRYGQVFTYHNGAQSYYAARAFRGILRLS